MNHANFFPFERNRYFYGKLLTVRDFEVEQRYHCSKRALLNRLLHGAGVVCGLGVTASDESTLMIESGVALDYQGREIVLPETLFRKLQMLEGQETLEGKKDAFLCLSYAQEDVEPVNATGADAGEGQQFDLTREGFRLYLTAEPPAYQSLLEASGRENVSVLYQSDDLILVLSVPANVCSGEEFQASVLVVKNENTPPVQFTLEGENTFVESDNGRVRLAWRESREEKRCVYTVDFPLRARALSDVDSQMFPGSCELNVELGSHHYKNYLTVEAAVHLCRDQEDCRMRRQRLDDLERHLRGRELPIYLAKLELIHSAGGVFVGSVTSLPFQQSVSREAEQGAGGAGDFTVTTSVRSLEYWQKPDVKAVYQPSVGALHLDFGIPSPEQYDYAVAHGTVDLTMPGGIRVNSRVFSEEIAHGLGAGAAPERGVCGQREGGDRPAVRQQRGVQVQEHQALPPVGGGGRRGVPGAWHHAHRPVAPRHGGRQPGAGALLCPEAGAGHQPHPVPAAGEPVGDAGVLPAELPGQAPVPGRCGGQRGQERHLGRPGGERRRHRPERALPGAGAARHL